MASPLQTQLFLREHGLAELSARFSIKSVRHERYPNLILLKYNQIFSPMAEPIVQECRGLILDENADFAVVSHPFHKFFNAGEPGAAPVNWNTARVFEKLDGSLMSLYFYDGAWQVASSGMPDARGALGTRETETMAQIWWETWRDLGLTLPPENYAGWWFGFELMTPWNQVVVRHETAKITAIGARRPDGQEVWPDDLDFGWPVAVSFELENLAATLEAAAQIPKARGEGFVVCDADFQRVKIKSPDYVALHYLRDRLSIPRLLEIARSGESDEFVAYFPYLAPHLTDIRARYEALITQIETDYAAISALKTPRDFAEAAKTKSTSAALFALRNHKASSAREFAANVNLASLLRQLGLRETDDAPMSD